jgi:SSS family solute:Na+ symporter
LIAKALLPHLESPDQAYPALLAKLMPAGLLGLTVAGIAAALMGHLSATYNSIATLFTRDFYLRWNPDASQEKQVFTGRVAVLAVFVIGALWAPVIGQFNSLWIYLQSVGAYLMMPFVGVFYLGVLWKRVTTQGVMAAVAAGFIAGPLLMFDSRNPFLPFMQTPVMCPWLHGAIVEFAICVIALAGVSLLTKPQTVARLASTTVDWSGELPADEPSPVRRSVLADYRVWLALLVTLTAGLWWLLR